jgi:hypothetical protein
MNAKKDPVIIIGMHRSGTSLISRLLQELGLFVGWDNTNESEAKFFLARNEKLFQVSGGSWDNPKPIDVLVQNEELRAQAIRILTRDLQSWRMINYLGPQRYFEYSNVFNLDVPWGWKDPRNTFLLPLWLDIFPNAKIVHIYRNGVDVAQSLGVREQKRIANELSRHPELDETVRDQWQQLKQSGGSLYLFRKLQNRVAKMHPLERYEHIKVRPCISVEKGFELWSTYMERVYRILRGLSNPVYELKYEEFLAHPFQFLDSLQQFCELNAGTERIQMVSTSVNAGRRYAFTNNGNLVKFYEDIRSNYWMERLGYNQELLDVPV